MDEKPYWIAFSFFEGIGPLRFKLLLNYFGSAKAIWKASPKELEKTNLGPKIIERFLQFRDKVEPEKFFALENNLFLKNNYPLENIFEGIVDLNRKEDWAWVTKYRRWRQSQPGKIAVLSWLDKEYPEKLKVIEASPPILYLKINSKCEIRSASWRTKQIKNQENLNDANKANKIISNLWRQPSIAVVGSRKISPYGQQVTKKLVSQLVSANFLIVSGMANGTDGLAHQTAIDSGGKTIAVLGNGVDIIYPPQNNRLYFKIDLVVSEFPPGFPPLPGNFPARNRIVAGLADAVLVVEAAQKSGSLITPKIAVEQGKEVFAVPGPITSPNSEGTNWLIKQGAKLVYSVEDILSEFKINPNYLKQSNKIIDTETLFQELNEEEKKVFEAIKNEPLLVDDIIAKTGIDPIKVNIILTTLKLKRIVKEFSEGVWGI